MQQKYAVYFNRKVLLFNNTASTTSPNAAVKSFDYHQPDALHEAVHWLDNASHPESIALLPHPNPKVMIDLLKTTLPVQTAAGGLVQAPDDRFLWIQRLGFWDLPKGKPEGKESPAETALREVEEETGVRPLPDIEFLCHTWHTYMHKGELILKESAWYSMHSADAPPLIPQTEEAISDARWLHRDAIASILPNAWLSVRDVWTCFLAKE